MGTLVSAAVVVGLVPQSAASETATVPNGSVMPASMPAAITPMVAGSSWVLTSTETGAVPNGHRTSFAADIAAFEPRVGKHTLAEVLTDLNVKADALCHETNAAGAQGFCWDNTYGDDGFRGEDMIWAPQGITGSGESRANEQYVNGRRVVVTSWYSQTGHPTYGKEDLMRVTFADVTDPVVTYRHALLVTPTASGFTNLRGHANSVTWYKNYLYVSTSAGLAVFDVTRIWQVDESVGSVGAANGTYGAAWHKYVLPQVNRYQNLYLKLNDKNVPEYAPTNCGSQFTGVPPCFAGVSLDDSASEPALVTTEVGEVTADQHPSYATKRAIVRWRLDKGTGLLKNVGATPETDDPVVRPESAYQSTVTGAQGIAMNRGRIVVSAVCPEYIERQTRIASCLYHAWPGEPVRLWTRTGIYGQNVSYWSATNELWTLNEAPGDRTVFHIGWPTPPVPVRSLTGLGGSLTGDNRPDILAIRPDASPGTTAGDGNLALYPGADSGVGVRRSIGTSWNAMRLLAGVGDLTADGRPDVMAVDTDGKLWLYPGATDGLGSRIPLSTGWGIIQTMTGVGDLTGDGLPDLMAVWSDGTAHLYPGKDRGLGPAKSIGTSWNAMRLLAGVGDLTADGRPDVMAVDTDGKLWLYPGVTDGLGSRIPLSTGWGIIQTMTGVGDLTGDGLPDLMAVWSDGTAHLYPGKDRGLGTRIAVNLGWSTA
ncbi:VCBS repeat-containing protein [Streptomyces sp. NPDC048266]|uniref:FG-GAP repeat domain-containing protein n=1 Tax=Streptomyces sp. NPDC048266 TaxID=3155787 RepID=UPI0033FE4A6E